MNPKKLISQEKDFIPRPAPSSKLVRDHSPSTMESGHETGAGLGMKKYKNKKYKQ
jgi:hypothetical protein